MLNNRISDLLSEYEPDTRTFWAEFLRVSSVMMIGKSGSMLAFVGDANGVEKCGKCVVVRILEMS